MGRSLSSSITHHRCTHSKPKQEATQALQRAQVPIAPYCSTTPLQHRIASSYPAAPMASFAAQIKEKLLGLVGRVASFGRGDKNVQEPTRLRTVQRVEVRSRGGEPPVQDGSHAGVNTSHV